MLFIYYKKVKMFVRIKRHPGTKNCSVLICYSVRQGHRIQQKILSRVGIAHGTEDLFRLKTQAEQQLMELRETKQNVQAEMVNNMFSLNNIREISRQNSGVPDILGNFYDTLGF